MPKELEERLTQQADAHGYTGERKDAYVYGTLAKIRKRRKSKK